MKPLDAGTALCFHMDIIGPGPVRFCVRYDMRPVFIQLLGAFGIGLAISPTFAAGTGLTGDYYDNNDFTTLKATRIDPAVDFDWGAASPTNVVAADTFSVRWSGQIEPRYSETYLFYVTADDGARLWVNDRLLLARTTYSASALEMTGRINLVAGQRYNIVLEFIEGSGNARVKLEWSSASQGREVIPQSQLYPALALPERGSIRAEHWMNLPGTNVADLTASANFPAHPDARGFVISFECLQTNWADNYGTRVSGWVMPPTNGTYRFAVSGERRRPTLSQPGHQRRQ